MGLILRVRFFFTAFLCLALSLTAYGQLIPADWYAEINSLFLNYFGVDENAGLTTLRVLNVPSGGHSESVAGAFSAVLSDSSFIEWNPAGAAVVQNTQLSFFHNNWIAGTNVDSLVYTTRWDTVGLAFGGKWLYIDFLQNNQYGETVSKGYYSELVATANAALRLFPGYYFEGISVGLNLKGAGRFVPDFADSTGYIDPSSGANQSGITLMADLGLLTRINFLKFYYSREKNMAFALVAKNAGFPLLGDPLPTVISGGFSWKPIRPIQLSFDITQPLNLLDPALSANLWWAAGISAQITNFLAMRAGFMLRSSAWRLTVGSGITLKDFKLEISYTLDQLTQIQALNRLSLAVHLEFGDKGRAARDKKAQELYLQGLEEYAKGNIDLAKELWLEVLKLDKTFDPAREGLKIIENTEALEQRIDDIQRLE